MGDDERVVFQEAVVVLDERAGKRVVRDLRCEIIDPAALYEAEQRRLAAEAEAEARRRPQDPAARRLLRRLGAVLGCLLEGQGPCPDAPLPGAYERLLLLRLAEVEAAERPLLIAKALPGVSNRRAERLEVLRETLVARCDDLHRVVEERPAACEVLPARPPPAPRRPPALDPAVEGQLRAVRAGLWRGVERRHLEARRIRCGSGAGRVEGRILFEEDAEHLRLYDLECSSR
ncbi:MAG: hypothetical protein D6729_17485 [Deltaproteobacteria bacterium]|nr:MAG: hypothetical protein D6729_17485 [Deltaproteobacteria bacterium]